MTGTYVSLVGLAVNVTSAGRVEAISAGPGASAGMLGPDLCAGGGHGGSGAGADPRSAVLAYGSVIRPVLPGSQGCSRGIATGGLGGGVVNVTAQLFVLDGLVSADGFAGGGNATGGGSGGSVLIEVAEMQGAGEISADGGKGTEQNGLLGGGGGGGRIAIHHSYSTFTGGLHAFGGVGPTQAGYEGGPGMR